MEKWRRSEFIPIKAIALYMRFPCRVVSRHGDMAVTNAVIVWNTVYMVAVVEQLKQAGYPVQGAMLFRRIEQDPQFHGHYMCAFGSLEVMLTGRAYLAQEAAAALG
jgi:hypothetical protein